MRKFYIDNSLLISTLISDKRYESYKIHGLVICLLEKISNNDS